MHFLKRAWCVRDICCRYKFYKPHIQVDKSQLYSPSRTLCFYQTSLSPIEIWPLKLNGHSFNSMISWSFRYTFQMNSVNASLFLPTPFLSGVASDFQKILWNLLIDGVCVAQCLSSGSRPAVRRGRVRRWSGDRSRRASLRKLTIGRSENRFAFPQLILPPCLCKCCSFGLERSRLHPLPSHHPLADKWLFTFRCTVWERCFLFDKIFISNKAPWSFSWQAINQKPLLTSVAIWLVRKLGGSYGNCGSLHTSSGRNSN